MNILTNDEINELSHPAARGQSVNACIMAAEKLILEKLAGMELPVSPYVVDALHRVWTRVGFATPTDGDNIFSATQLHQAFAQGAASQLSAEPVGWFKYDKVSLCWHPQHDKYAERYAKEQAWNQLYTLKAPK